MTIETQTVWFKNHVDGKWHVVPKGQSDGFALCMALVIPTAVVSGRPSHGDLCHVCNNKSADAKNGRDQ